MKIMIKYSVIVPFHSNKNLFSLCIDQLFKVLDLNECEIIIVDNNVNGSQMDIKAEYIKHCNIISRQDNLMYSRAINLGVSKARGEYLIFCDADAIVTKGFYRELTKELESGEIGYASAKLLNMHTRLIQDFGISSSYYNFPHPYLGRPYDYQLVNSNHFPLAACAACSAIRKKIFEDIGGFDEALLNSYSDIDLCLRLSKQGYKTVCVSNAIAFHNGSSTTDSGMGNNLKEDTKGIFMAKHPNISIQIDKYIDFACDYFLSQNKFRTKDYFIIDCSSVGNSELYLNTIINNLNLQETGKYKHPYPYRDAQKIDFLNFIPYTIRNYKIPILYFVDHFLAFQENDLWKMCRQSYFDIVADRHSNIELICNI